MDWVNNVVTRKGKVWKNYMLQKFQIYWNAGEGGRENYDLNMSHGFLTVRPATKPSV